MYASYRLLQTYRQHAAERQTENYVNDSGTTTTFDTVWLVVLGLALLLDLVLIGFGTYYAIKCQSLGRIPMWLAVVLILLLWMPSPLQPFFAVTMTIWGGATGCGE